MAHVDQEVDPMLLEEREERIERPRGVADCEQGARWRPEHCPLSPRERPPSVTNLSSGGGNGKTIFRDGFSKRGRPRGRSTRTNPSSGRRSRRSSTAAGSTSPARKRFRTPETSSPGRSATRA